MLIVLSNPSFDLELIDGYYVPSNDICYKLVSNLRNLCINPIQWRPPVYN